VSESRPHRHLRVSRDGAVQTITLSNVARRNAQTPSMWLALAEFAASLDPEVRVVVLSGEGPSFSSGLDRAMLTHEGVEGEVSLLDAAARGADPVARMIEPLQRGYAAWADVDALVVASCRAIRLQRGLCTTSSATTPWATSTWPLGPAATRAGSRSPRGSWSPWPAHDRSRQPTAECREAASA
jgi:enoyl-CoA hydratase/carnithine racemase